MNARYYNLATGVFTSQDTYYGNAYMPQAQHLYSYTGGNPVNYIDPTGHSFWGVVGGIAMGVAGCALIATGFGAVAGIPLLAAAYVTVGTGLVVWASSNLTKEATGVNPIEDAVGEDTYNTVETGLNAAAIGLTVASLAFKAVSYIAGKI